MTESSETRWARLSEVGRGFLAQGDLQRADDAFQAAIREATTMGGDGLQLATSLGNLGQLRYRQRNFAEAEQLFQEALSLRERALGADHLTIVQSINNLAALLYARGEMSRAEALFQRALAVSEQHLGAEHPDLAVNLNNLAKLYIRLRDFASAVPLLRRLLAIREAVHGPHHPEVAAVLAMLARAQDAVGAADDALQLCERAHEIQQAYVEAGDPALLSTERLLAELRARCGERAHTNTAAPEVSTSARDSAPALLAIPALEEQAGPESAPTEGEPARDPDDAARSPRESGLPVQEVIAEATASELLSETPEPFRIGPPNAAVVPPPAAPELSPPAEDPDYLPVVHGADPVPPIIHGADPVPPVIPDLRAGVTPVASRDPHLTRVPGSDSWSMDPREVDAGPSTSDRWAAAPHDTPAPRAPAGPDAEPAPADATRSALDRLESSHKGDEAVARRSSREATPADVFDAESDADATALIEEMRTRRSPYRSHRWGGARRGARSAFAAAALLAVVGGGYFVFGRSDADAGTTTAVEATPPASTRSRPDAADFDRKLPRQALEGGTTAQRSDAAISDMAPRSGGEGRYPDDDALDMRDEPPLPTVRIQVDGVARHVARAKARVDSLGRELPQEPIQFQRPASRGP